MDVVQGIDALEPSLGRLFVAIGVFDGLHLGHQYLLRELREAAARHDARPTVITFDHHPDEILVGNAPALLCDPDERLAHIQSAGIDVTVIQHFDLALRRTPFDVFIRRIAERIELAGFLMTPDSAFGFERAGTPETVAALGRDLGYDVTVVPAFELDGQPVSSSEIRRAIAAGDLATAERLLGRPYAVVGLTSRAARDPVLTFDMPVAMPPAGLYLTRIEDVDEAVDHGVNHAHVQPPGIRLDGIWIGGPRLRLTFEA
ncbi:MAG TPA: FAD synthetase family protein [Candidatus Limnocylindrales bacterium]|nr:FAD synthetase family protein [Candidatus Limnocylindrales bacterium]